MPTVRVEYNPFTNKPVDDAVNELYKDLPYTIAAHLNIEGHDLHDGGVSEKEIIVNLIECDKRDLNTNDIQITIIAHRFEERVARNDEVTKKIGAEINATLRQEVHCGEYDDITFAVSIWLVEMSYVTFGGE